MKKTVLLILLLSVIILAREIPDGFTKVKELGGITEYELSSNGLIVLLMEDHSAPVLTFMVTYRVGSRNEVTGTTGATHLLEHLMFKGTDKFNKAKGKHIDNLLGNIGARLNATTWLDRTNYYESIPNEFLELAVEIEADRLRNLWLREEDRQAEMTVVRNEFERGENSPFQALDKEIWAAAFQAHPYHHSTIGWRSDIENVPIEKLRAFYDTFYWPNNATVTVIGDFKTDEALSLIKKYYGEIPKSPHPIPQVYTTEPGQQGSRRVEVNRAGQVGVVGIGHKVPQALHYDSFTLLILDKILTDGKTSRLYKALVDKGKAVNVFNFYVPFKDPGLFITYSFLTPGTTHPEVEEIILAELEKIKNDGVTKEEVTRAINQITSETAYGRDGSFSVASQINETIAMGDWTLYIRYPEEVKKVTPQNVKDAAEEYFQENKRTTGYFIPKVPGGQQAMKGAAPRSSHSMEFYRDPGLNQTSNESEINQVVMPLEEASISKNIKDQKISGIRVLTAKTNVKDVVTFRGSLAAGDAFSPEGNCTIADLTGYMLDKGTTKQDKFALAEKLENLGASINFSVGLQSLNFNGKCLAKDVKEVITLLAEQLMYPAFNQEEFDKLKAQRKGAWKQSLENTNVRADEKLSELIFSKDHPNYGVSMTKLLEEVDKTTLEDVKALHKKYYGPQSMVFVLVGDLDENTIASAIESSFEGWSGGIDYPYYEKANTLNTGIKEIVRMEEKTSATLTIGQVTGLKRSDEDYIAFYIANQIFGGGGFSARLMSIIRDDEGLTYGIYSGHNGDIFSDGYWNISGTFSPDLLAQGYSSTMRELNRWVNEGVTQEELDLAKTRITGSYKVQLVTTNGMASQILSFVERGFDPAYMDEYPELVNALTLNQVNEVIKKYIDPDKMVTVVAGTVTEDDLIKK